MALSIKFNAPVTLTFSLVCTLILVADVFLMGNVMPFFTAYPGLNFSNPLQIVTLFSHVLGHVNISHLLGNLTFVLLLGPIIEEKYGTQKLLTMILITALITGLVNAMFFDTGLMGASGIVFMMILLVSFTNVRGGEIPLTFILVTILFVGKEFLASTESNQIAESAHIIGGFCGSLFGFRAAR